MGNLYVEGIKSQWWNVFDNLHNFGIFIVYNQLMVFILSVNEQMERIGDRCCLLMSDSLSWLWFNAII
jgi:hypothetical protein